MLSCHLEARVCPLKTRNFYALKMTALEMISMKVIALKMTPMKIPAMKTIDMKVIALKMTPMKVPDRNVAPMKMLARNMKSLHFLSGQTAMTVAVLAFCLFIFGCGPGDPREGNDGMGTDAAGRQVGEILGDELLSGEVPVLVTNAHIVDGTGAEARRGEVLIENGRIAAVFFDDEGGQDEQSGDHQARIDRQKSHDISERDDLYRIDAGGKVLAPGFIDAHAHGNPLSTPEFDNFLHMGVTTVSLGQDGRSPEEGSVSEWMDRVDNRGTGVHILHFIGHGTVRERAGASPVTGLEPAVLQQMQQIIDDAMRDGSFGLSTGTEYNPGYHADAEELAAIARPVAEHGGLVMSHIRSEDDDLVEAAIEELIEQGRRSGAHVHVSHIKIVFGKGEERAEEVMAVLHRAREEGVEVTADLYPYAASFTGIGIVFPDWAMPPNDFDSVRTHRRDDLREFLHERVMLRNGPEATLFGTAPWAGMTLAEVADSLDKPFEDVLIDDIPPGSASAAYFVMDEDVVRRLLLDPLVMVSSDGSPTMRHPRGYGSFAKIIRQYVIEEEVLSLEEAVHKMTGLTASTLGLDDVEQVAVPRGLILEGFAADLVVFDPVEVRDSATFEEPHRLAEGMSWVFVDGVPVIAEGVRQPVNPAGVIRRRSASDPQ